MYICIWYFTTMSLIKPESVFRSIKISISLCQIRVYRLSLLLANKKAFRKLVARVTKRSVFEMCCWFCDSLTCAVARSYLAERNVDPNQEASQSGSSSARWGFGSFSREITCSLNVASPRIANALQVAFIPPPNLHWNTVGLRRKIVASQLIRFAGMIMIAKRWKKGCNGQRDHQDVCIARF